MENGFRTEAGVATVLAGTLAVAAVLAALATGGTAFLASSGISSLRGVLGRVTPAVHTITL